MQKEAVRSLVDRVVRYYASSLLQGAGFTSAACALASTPEIVDVATADEARSRVNAALAVVLSAKEVPQTERALIGVLAAREALALVRHDEPSQKHLKRLVETLHAVAS